MKVFNQSSKRKPCIVRQLHNFTGQFESIKHLHQVLQSEMTGSLPPHYVIGYYEGRHHTKRWLTSDEDLTVMNKKFCNGNISMWCDAREASDEDSSPSRDQERSRERSPKRSPTKKCGKREDKENEVDDIFQDLKIRHGDDYSGPQLRLWARMVSNGVHEDRDSPPSTCAHDYR